MLFGWIYSIIMFLLVRRVGAFRFSSLVQNRWATTSKISRTPQLTGSFFRHLLSPNTAADTYTDLETKTRKHKSKNSLSHGPEWIDFLAGVKARDFAAVCKAVDDMKSAGMVIKDSYLFTFLSVCTKAEHLSKAIEITEHLKAKRATFTEGVHLALIRCLADAGKLDKAVALIQEIVHNKGELKPRLFQPILEKLLHSGDLHRMLALVKYMVHLKVVVGEEQLTAMLSVLQHRQVREQLQTDIEMRNTLNALLTEISEELIGIYTENMHQIVSAVNNISLEQAKEQGVLVTTAADITGEIISTEETAEPGVVLAMNTSYHRVATLLTERNAFMESDFTVADGAEPIPLQLVPEKYVVLFENSSETLLQGLLEQQRRLPARVVDISRRTSRCPNCDQEVMPLLLSDEDKRHVCGELYKLMKLSKPHLQNDLDEFASWLRSRPEYEYIIDGANVAYQGQNFQHGRFSFGQIELIMDKLTQKGRRALVVLPYIYTSGPRIPNNSGDRSRRHSELTADDERIIRKLQANDMVYITPSGANDDWYWLYATIYEGRSTPACVVSNDFMRDHKVAFAESKAFMRWRSSQIVLFQFDKSMMPVELRGEGYKPPSVTLYEPGKFTREIQRAGESDCWHIPAADRNVWLCVDICPPPPPVEKQQE